MSRQEAVVTEPRTPVTVACEDGLHKFCDGTYAGFLPDDHAEAETRQLPDQGDCGCSCHPVRP